MPRLPGLNFYYEQEDVLFDVAARRNLTWSVHRPHTMIGYTLGNAMNMAVTLAVAASICRHTGRPFVFPGSRAQFDFLTDVTDARNLADQILWAATAQGAANRAYNIVNGDIFRWRWMWGEIAGYFGLVSAGCPEVPQPFQSQMADADEIWPAIVARHGLQDNPAGRLASWWHTDADLGREIECVTDMTESRVRGFSGYRSSRQSFFDVFDTLVAERVIPDPNR
jgi:nucleoside-diphosphate-sugar epimerase